MSNNDTKVAIIAILAVVFLFGTLMVMHTADHYMDAHCTFATSRADGGSP